MFTRNLNFNPMEGKGGRGISPPLGPTVKYVMPFKISFKGVCVRLFRHSNRGLISKGTIGSPVGKRPPFAKRVQNKKGTMGGPRLPVFTSLYERVHRRLWGTCNNRTIVARKEIQWHNGTPQEKF